MKTIRLFALLALTFAAGWLASRLSSPATVEAQNHRVFELRVYHVNPGKLAALQTFFHDHAQPSFQRHNMTSIGYWVPQDKPESENTWIYILAHPSREEAKKNWDAMRADPAFSSALKASQSNGELVSKIDSTYMDPAEISAMK